MARPRESDGAETARAKDASLGAFVRTKLREAIEQGRFRPGERIRENDVAKWLNVSRTPIRQALRHLEKEGLLNFIPWRGVVVAELDRQQVLELYSMRVALEGLAARLAARYISDPEIEHLREFLADAGRNLNDPERMAEINRAFHSAIYEASHNRYLMQTLNSMRSSLALLQGTTFSVPGRAERAHEEHLAVFEAIRCKDEDAAEATAQDHLREAERVRLRMMSNLR